MSLEGIFGFAPLAYYALAAVTTAVLAYFLIPMLKKAGITGKDINKPDRPLVAEMGGLAIVGGFTSAALLAIFLQTFVGIGLNPLLIMAPLITIYLLAFIGIADDLLDIPQAVKAFLPLLAAVPLIAVKAAGSTAMTFPFIGTIDFGIFYIIVLVPVGIAVMSNLTNMFAGFNGMEAGMGIVIFATTSLLALSAGKPGMLVISIGMLGALAGFFYFNRFPARIFPGDVGNLSIGAVLACAVIIGNFETAGAILAIPYVIDFFIKAWNRFPSKGWQGSYRGDRLYAPEKPVSFAQLVMRAFNGISEQRLVLFFIGLEVLFAAIVLILYF
jgi:UDP-N-acetylglucosamine--dolichyl-phosphate N-acetylglucosaminephosphotransferase